MELVGTLHGVDIHLPLQRSEIRELVAQERKIAQYKADRHNISLFQARNDLNDIQDEFIKKNFVNEADQIKFLNLLTEEYDAVTNELNMNTLRTHRENLQKQQTDLEISQIFSWGILAVILIGFLLFAFAGHR